MAMQQYHPPTEPWIERVFEDEGILVVNKPSGLLSVPGRAEEHYDSMWSRLKDIYPDIQPVHRLDMSTSGLMLFAKNKPTESALKNSFSFASRIRSTMLVYGDALNNKREKWIFH